MHASSNSKSSSSDDDLLLDSELTGATRKKHFLDYDYDHQSPPTRNSTINDVRNAKINVASHSKATVSSDNGNLINIHNGTTAGISSNNNANAQQLVDSKKKINDRPSTSKMTTVDQLNANTKKSNLANNGESVYAILTMLGNVNSADISSKFLECSKNREMCATLRLSGCMSLLVQMIHSESSTEKQQKECLQALHNIIQCHPDDKAGRREARAIKLIEQLLDYCDSLVLIMKNELSDNLDRYPIQAIGTLMKISFDEEHRYAMCQLGALQTIAKLIQLDHAVHGPLSTDTNCVTMRRYAGMCLTNLTFGDGNNKALLCSNKKFMRALVDQINSSSDELVPVTASVIRNLSWRADTNMKEILNEINTVKILTIAAMKCSQENTLKAILSALWNLSNHCAKNKAEFCEIQGSIEFLVDMLSYEATSKTTTVIENAGGILRNVSTHIAEHEELRAILRRKTCLSILLRQLKSPSLTVVSNACGTLGNLSAHCTEDQDFLRENGAIPMLRSLIYSKHKMISMGSTIALRHLLAYKSNVMHNDNLDSVAKMMDLKELPTLNVRKQKALENELSFSCEQYKIDDTSPSTKDDKTKDYAGCSKDKVNRANELKVQNIEDDEEEEEAPTNFSKFDDDQEAERSEYQEVNSDQITDYSIRYSENQSDFEEAKPAIIAPAEDTMKCYNTEGTPHAILSKAGSLSDLQKEKLLEIDEAVEAEEPKVVNKFAPNASGLQSPEKTVNYCVEGTPAIFSRCDSFSDLEESSPLAVNPDKSEQIKSSTSSAIPPPIMIRKELPPLEKDSSAATPKSVTFGNLAEETPLMFSRTSSMGSLGSAEPGYADEIGSVVSDFSRLASGIISPSELPDSPTQSIPQSPSRLNSRMNQQRNIGVSKTPPLPVTRETVETAAADDSFNVFNVENTPAAFSYATSLSNLSFDDEPKISTDAITKDFQLMKHPSCDEEKTPSSVEENVLKPTLTADQSDAESTDDDTLLKKCINIGMNRVTKTANDEAKRADDLNNGSNTSAVRLPGSFLRDGSQRVTAEAVKENPLDMMRTGAPLLPPYLPIVDELNKFIVEDSPCNLSMMSGLSAITIESNFNAVHQISKPTAKVEPTLRKDDVPSTSKKPPEEIAQQKQDFDDSLSSLSIESEDDGNLLTQTIAAGSKPLKSKEPAASSFPINIPLKPRPSAELCNESVSSVDSCSKDDPSNSILEQCIRSGINKVVKKDNTKSRERVLVTSSPKKSMLPTLNNKSGPSKSISIEKKVQDKRDEQLLQECITTGIMTNTRSDKPLSQTFTQLSISDPKNGETTSVIAMDKQCASTITGVEVKAEENNCQLKTQRTEFSSLMSESHDRDESIASRSEHSRQGNWTMPNGSNNNNGFDLNLSLGSIDDNILERSNEYPATKHSMGAYGLDEEDSIMEVSNEFMVENEKLLDVKIEDKHKDPDLMLKSVDRLTQELVSTAEYLRKNTTNSLSDEISFEQKMSGSLSNNNTWNDENSFPSISLTAPMIGSTNDETTFATDQVYPLPDEKIPEETQNQLLDDKTPTNENYTFNVKEDEADGSLPKIEFKVGGEIGAASLNKINFVSFGPTSIETNSTMSNSTIVQVEAKRIANKFTSMNNRLMDSTTSLDLENIRPPSSMDCISLNSYQEFSAQQSPLRHQKKSLMTGFVAKRALGTQMFSTSAESINSIHNIDSIRPPSIMDELLDSMISVDSIVSEIFDPTLGISNYETAMSDMEDSLTLRSCQDLSKDETLTLTSSDFSSVESTPKKRNSRSLTPKQKRQSDKDRYKTYTIQVDMLLKEQRNENSGTESMRKSLNARQRRQEDRQRFETQVISHSPTQTDRRKENPERYKTFKIESTDFDDDLSIRAMTENFKFLRNGSAPVNVATVDTAGIRMKLNRIKSGESPLTRATDDSLEYERQNSETESQRDLKNSMNHDVNSLIEHESLVVSAPSSPPQNESPKIKPTKSSYISPYRMTTRLTPMKTKAVKVPKTTIIAKVVSRRPGFDNKLTQNAIQKMNGKINAGKPRASVTAKIPLIKTNIPKSTSTPTHLEEPPAMPIRQGTFIQEEPTLENVPVVNDSSILPTKAPISKLKQPTRITSSSKIPTTPTEKNTSPKKTSNLPTSITQLKFRSNSNASMKTPVSAPVRSNTGICLNPKKNVTSKIAGIWKSGSEKKESLLKKPISTSSTQLSYGLKLSTPAGVNARKIVSTTGKDRIKRSSTCDEIV